MFGIDDAVAAGLKVVGQVIDRAWPDPTEAAKQKLEAEKSLRDAFLQSDQMQADTNKAEAANPSVFVAGWRPYIGWICGTALGLYYIPYFLVGITFWAVACWKLGGLAPRPDLGVGDLLGLLCSMLGIGAMRSFEKFTGVATTAIGKK